MKIRFKLSICIITIMTVIVTGTNILLLHKASESSLCLSIRSLEHLTDYQVEFWQGRQEGYIRTLYTLANIMGDYESIKAEERRDRYDDMLKSAFEAEPEIVTLYTVWKPNSIDGMDANFIGRTGSSPAGQYAIAYNRETDRIEGYTSYDINNVTAHINSPNAHKDCVDNPITLRVNGKDALVIRIEVPIFNQRTCEVVGKLGCFIAIDTIQQILENTIKTNDEIAAMALYSGNGTILAHYKPGRIGKLLFDADAELGDSGKMMYEAMRKGKFYRGAMYVPEINEKIIFMVKPFPIGDSEHNWSMLIGVSESYILREVRAIAGFTAMLTVTAILAAAVIFSVIIRFITKPITKVTDALKDISESEGNLICVIPERGNDEITDISRYFNRILRKIKNMVVSIKQKADAISRSASAVQAGDNTEQVVNKIDTHVEQQVSSADESSSSIKEMLANINSVTQTIIKNSENVVAKERRKLTADCGEQSDLKHAGKNRRFSGISAHTGGIAMFPIPARLAPGIANLLIFK